MKPSTSFCSFCLQEPLDSLKTVDEQVRKWYSELFGKTHRTTNSLVCESCLRKLEEAVAFRSMVLRSEQELLRSQELTLFTCKVCNRSFKDLESHVQEKHIKVENCGICDKQVPRSRLELHVLLHKKPDLVSEGEKQRFRRHFCVKCEKFFSNLRSHMLAAHRKEVAVCDVCGKGPMNRLSLNHHRRTFHFSREFTCDICGKVFRTRRDIKDHLLGVHMKHDPRAYCQHCGTGFHSLSLLNRHIRNVHKTPDFACSFCAKKFKKAHEKEKHERAIHTKPGDLKCPICHAGFNSKEALNFHQKREHAAEDPTVFKCFCTPTEFLSRAAFVSHQKSEHFDGERFYCFCQPTGWKSRWKFGTHLEQKHKLTNASAPCLRVQRAKRIKLRKEKGPDLSFASEIENLKTTSIVFYSS